MMLLRQMSSNHSSPVSRLCTFGKVTCSLFPLCQSWGLWRKLNRRIDRQAPCTYEHSFIQQKCNGCSGEHVAVNKPAAPVPPCSRHSNGQRHNNQRSTEHVRECQELDPFTLATVNILPQIVRLHTM